MINNLTFDDLKNIDIKSKNSVIRVSGSTAFAERLKVLRKTAKLNQQELGELLGVSKSTIGYYENQERTPDIDFLDKTSQLFSVPFDFLMGYSDNAVNWGHNQADSLSLSDKAFSKLLELDDFDYILSFIVENHLFFDLAKSIDDFVNLETDFNEFYDWEDYYAFIITKYFINILKDTREKITERKQKKDNNNGND